MILESLQEENINMRHFLLLPTPIFFSGEGKKKKRKKKKEENTLYLSN